MRETRHLLEAIAFPALQRGELTTLQVNLGYRCNQSCLHCHVNAGPSRKEMMERSTIDEVLALLARMAEHAEWLTLDLTGGAPELNDHFRYLVKQARLLGVAVIDRCNLTILSEPGQENLAEFLAEQQVMVVSSMPCYLKENVNAQRGDGVFDASIAGLRKLNALGYGEQSGLQLDLVYNPQGASLPPSQAALEPDYKKVLGEYGIRFNSLLTITNMPIKRFGSTLLSKGGFDDYMTLLRTAHSDDNLSSVMCRSLISVDWQGRVYDCDFNQMLDMPLMDGVSQSLHIRDLNLDVMQGRSIKVAGHCYGCTAGQGSSCGGALE